MKQLLQIFLLAVVATGTVISQAPTCENNSEILIDKRKPAVYITFVRDETQKPWNGGKGVEEVYVVELHNNSRWAINIVTEPLFPESAYAETQTCLGKVRTLSNDRNQVRALYLGWSREPYGFILSDDVWIAPGKSLLFPIRKSDLPVGRSIALSFSYQWQTDTDTFPRTGSSLNQEVVFHSYQLRAVSKKK